MIYDRLIALGSIWGIRHESSIVRCFDTARVCMYHFAYLEAQRNQKCSANRTVQLTTYVDETKEAINHEAKQ